MLQFCFLEIKSNYIKVKYLQSLDYRELFRIFKKLVFQTQVKKNPTGDLVHECTFSKENKIMNTEFLASQQFRVFDTETVDNFNKQKLVLLLFWAFICIQFLPEYLFCAFKTKRIIFDIHICKSTSIERQANENLKIYLIL